MRLGPIGSRRAARLVWLAGAALAACATREAPAPGLPVDDLGRTVALTQPAQRIVSLSPSTTELLFDLGAGSRVVGRTRWCDYPPQAAEVPSVGDGLNPNVELVLSRTPDLVVFYRSGANQGAIARLDRLGVATASVRLDRLADLPRVTRLLGRLTGTSGSADSLAATFAAAYTVRAKPGAPVSAPCTWQEVERGSVDPATFTLRNMRQRLADAGERQIGWPPRREAPKRLALALPIEPVGGRDVGARVAGRRLFDHHELVAVRVRKGAK